MTGLSIGYFQIGNYEQRESHLMKSENGNPAHHNKSTKRSGH